MAMFICYIYYKYILKNWYHLSDILPSRLRPQTKLFMILLIQIINKIHVSHPTCDAYKNIKLSQRKTKEYVQKLLSFGKKETGFYSLHS
jgi:hypothetical protein